MKLLVVLLIILGVGGFVVSWIATAYTRERRSIDRYSQTMGVMQKLSGEPHLPQPPAGEPNQHIKVMGKGYAANDASPRTVSRRMDPSLVAKALGDQAARRNPSPNSQRDYSGSSPDIQSPSRAFDDSGEALSPSQGSSRSLGRSKNLPGLGSAISPTPRSLAVAGAALVTVVVVVYLAVSFTGKPTKTGARVSVSTTTTRPPPVQVTTTVPVALAPVSSNSQVATFVAPSGSYTVVVTVSAPCWVAQSVLPGGVISWDAVLQPGQTRTITTSGSLTLRAGNSHAMTLTLDGSPARFTSNAGPYDVSFVVGG